MDDQLKHNAKEWEKEGQMFMVRLPEDLASYVMSKDDTPAEVIRGSISLAMILVKDIEKRYPIIRAYPAGLLEGKDEKTD